MRDETLADIAGHPPKAQGDLGKVRGLSSAWKQNDIGQRMMKVIADARAAARRRNAGEKQARRAAW